MKNRGLSRAKSSGFTLIETIIYIALFAILMSGAVVAAYSLLEGGGRNVTAIGIQEEGTFLSRKINWALAGASDVSTSGGGTVLTITRPDLGYQIVITGTGSRMTIARGAGGPLELNSDRYAVTGPESGDMFIVQPASGGRPPSVTASFMVQGKPFLLRTYMRQ